MLWLMFQMPDRDEQAREHGDRTRDGTFPLRPPSAHVFIDAGERVDPVPQRIRGYIANLPDVAMGDSCGAEQAGLERRVEDVMWIVTPGGSPMSAFTSACARLVFDS
jgi:hypothetical protein